MFTSKSEIKKMKEILRNSLEKYIYGVMQRNMSIKNSDAKKWKFFVEN